MALTNEEVMYNIALGYVGEYQVEDTADSRLTKQYGLCSRFYDLARDMIMTRHNWNEATERVIVIQSATAPLFEYSFKYAIPTSPKSLKIVAVGNRNSWGMPSRGDIWPWEPAGSFILTNNSEGAPSWGSGVDYIAGQYVSDTNRAWATATAYLDGQVVQSGTTAYEAASDHTSGVLADDVTAGKMVDIGEQTKNTYLCNTTHTSATATRPQTDTTTWTSQSGDLNIMYLTYIKQLTDTDDFGPLLKNVIAMQLASMIITALHNDPKAKIDLVNEIERLLLPQARTTDSMQGKPKQLFSSQYRRSRGYGY